jgi:Uma2 family endonuclease
MIALSNYLEREPVGHVFMSPSDISWGPDTLVQPDVFVVPLEQARTMNWREIRQLLLAMEVLSPSSFRADRFTKRRLYQAQRVPLSWVIDADQHSVEVWTPVDPFPRQESEELVWTPAGASVSFRIELADLFRPL